VVVVVAAAMMSRMVTSQVGCGDDVEDGDDESLSFRFCFFNNAEFIALILLLSLSLVVVFLLPSPITIINQIETKLYIGMSDMQRAWYTKVLSKDAHSLNALGGPDKVKLLNVLMQLRKVI
jgi:hypothetical protein